MRKASWNRLEHWLYPNRYGWMLLLFFFLLLPNLAVVGFCTELSLFKRLAALVFAVLLWTVPSLFLRARHYFLLMGLLWLPAPVEIGCAYLNRMPLTEGLVSAIYNTDWKEATELIRQFVAVLPLIGALWFAYFWIACRKIENVLIWKRPGWVAWMGLFLFFNGGIWLSMYALSCQHRQDLWGQLEAANDSFWKKYQIIFPCDYLYFTGRIAQMNQTIASMEQQSQAFRFGAVRRDTVQSSEIYLLLIGESARYDHFGINGYARETTPHLDTVPGLLSYNNVYASANLTEYVLPYILTRATPATTDLQYKEKALPDAFQEAGFYTVWIANQGDNYPLIRRIARDANEQHFAVTSFNSSASRDEHLLPLLDQVLAKKRQRLFVVVHTHGSHFQYDVRYPEAFARFQPSMEGRTTFDDSETGRERMINSYDNTILYTDYFINEVINRLRQQQAVGALIYLSDHAESLYDEPERRILHGNTVLSVPEVHIPLFVWLSDAYRATYPDKVQLLEERTGKRLSSTNLFDTFLDIAQIHYPDEHLEESFASSLFQEDSLRYVLTPNHQIISLK